MNAAVKYENKFPKDNRSNNIAISLNHHELKDRNAGGELMDIIRTGNITTVFQPIISLKDGNTLGYEALTRGPKNSVLENPSKLFNAGRTNGKLWELELLCRNKALANVPKNSPDINIFLNVDPYVLADERFQTGFTSEFLKSFDLKAENIVLEVTENNSVDNIDNFKKIIEHYKAQGFKIAVDDTGSGYSGLKLITEIHPHFIKLDMNLIRGLDRDGLKHALIKTFYEFCTVTDIKLIAEGIETRNELNTLIEIGINFGQGYFIQKPMEDIMEIKDDVLDIIKKQNMKKNASYHSRSSSVCVGDICSSNMTIKPSFTGSNVHEIFNNNPSIFGLPVVENNKLVGLVMKDKFFANLGTQYGYALFHNRPVSLLMDRHPLAVNYETSIDIVSKIAMTRSGENLYDYIIVTDNSAYCGIVTVKDLLEKTTELEINYAKHLNPLSGLPGNMLIERKLNDLLSNTSPFTVLYIDIDNFKVYNDIYGFENGDRLLQFLGRAIDNAVKECFYNNFIGHIGGDDFIIIAEGYDVDALCASIISAFENGITDFYTSEDIQRKFVPAKNRHGVEEQFGLATISIAGISSKNRNYKDIFELSEYAGKLKKKCKEIWNSCYIIE